MNKRDDDDRRRGGKPLRDGEAAILFQPVADGTVQLTRRPAVAPWSAIVQEYWLTTWNQGGQPARVVKLIPSACVNVTFKRGRSRVTGVSPTLFAEELEGQHRVFGVRFRPGGFRGLLGRPVHTITGKFLALPDVFGSAADRLEDKVLAAAGIDEMIGLVEEWLSRLCPPKSDPNAALVASVVDAIVSDSSLVRVDQRTNIAGCSARQLQRLFADYVGVSPKWTLRRYRMQKAAARASDQETVNWSDLAHDLGYSDQPHFVRDFAATIGLTPNSYRATLSQPPRSTPNNESSAL